MKDKPSEWIAISDLMAGVMAVVMLLLVVAVLQKGVSDLRLQEELARVKDGKPDPVARMTEALQKIVERQGLKDVMVFDSRTSRLILLDGVFERGSACMAPITHDATSMLQEVLAQFLITNQNARIFVEGYTDNLPVKHPVTDYLRFCTVYDDNFTLSAARAREARRALIGTLDASVAKRVVVAGYGDSRPLSGIDPEDSRNRRVEVRFLAE